MATESKRTADTATNGQDFIVSPFTVAVDTREQFPWGFTGLFDSRRRRPILVQMRRQTLQTGDYSIVGLENEIAIERKSKEDAYQTFGRNRDRFERELERLAKMQFAAVVIEADWTDLLLDPPPLCKLQPLTVSRSIMAWSVRYGVHFFTIPTRVAAERAAWQILKSFWYQHESENEKEKESQSNG